MPIIRDISWTLEATVSDAGIVIPMPAYEGDDLLLAFIQSDTGTPAVARTGWVTVFARTNTCSLTVLRKIATASIEPLTASFTAVVNETYNGAIMSISNVDVASPINTFNDATQAAASKFQFQSITTTRDNCLVLFASANSAVGVPSIIEGGVIGVLGADGTAESQGIGWTIQPLTGATTTAISCSNIATGAGVKAVLAINPPSTGTLYVPTYCASDSSVYIDPINGTTAYNTNAAFGTTADTLFGTLLNGDTVVDATVAAAADAGLNSFHSVALVTTITSVVNWSAGSLDLATANNLNVTGKNIIVHTSPSTAGQIQRFPTVAASKKGIAFGMKSATGPYKTWYVHGAGTAWGQSSNVPLVINSSAPTGSILQSSGSFTETNVDAFGFWVSSKGVGTTAWQFYSLWMLDTTVVAGGNVSASVDIPGIVNACATGHERRSIIQQGQNQALVLQPVQFGNGGTNPIYLDLNATAIEFPSLYNLTQKNINYCSAENVAGLTYYAGNSDTIKHRNSVISSTSSYHWRIHPSSSFSASYDFSGLSIIGAGDVILQRLTSSFSQVSFSNCGVIVQNSASITLSRVSTSITSSALRSNAPGLISYSTFTSPGTGHAIEIVSPGVASFVGNTFIGYGLDNTTDSAIFNNSSGSVTLNISAGGTSPTVRNGTLASTTINNNVTITLTGLRNPTEVRVYTAGTRTELTGQEDVTTGTYAFSVGSGVLIDVSILSLGYQNQRLLSYSTTTDATLPISQQIDRQYLNP